MPTPFTHLEIAQRLMRDEDIPADMRALLNELRAAFLLGSVAPDARIVGAGREATHFYAYNGPIHAPLWRLMLAQHPSLTRPHSKAHAAFLAGYSAHLAVDETWALKMLGPHFVAKEWNGVGRYDRFLALHLILIHMDERDTALLEDWQGPALLKAPTKDMLPFMPDDVLRGWRDFLGSQLVPGGVVQTVNVLAPRVQQAPEAMRVMLDTPQQMHNRLWQYVSQEVLAEIEARFYANARTQLVDYLAEYGTSSI